MPKKKEKKYMGKNTQDVIKFNQSQFKGINGKSASAFYSAIEHGNTKRKERIRRIKQWQNGKKEIQNEL